MQGLAMHQIHASTMRTKDRRTKDRQGDIWVTCDFIVEHVTNKPYLPFLGVFLAWMCMLAPFNEYKKTVTQEVLNAI